jgi:hypothetical protein
MNHNQQQILQDSLNALFGDSSFKVNVLPTPAKPANSPAAMRAFHRYLEILEDAVKDADNQSQKLLICELAIDGDVEGLKACENEIGFDVIAILAALLKEEITQG